MTTPTISEIKRQLEMENRTDLIAFCLRLSKFKRENKELITFLLFEAGDITAYIRKVRQEIISSFNDITSGQAYHVKKSVRKILRNAGKYIRIAGSKLAEAEILMQFCISLQSLPPSIFKNRQIFKIYETQVVKAKAAISALHPDLQYDLEKEMSML